MDIFVLLPKNPIREKKGGPNPSFLGVKPIKKKKKKKKKKSVPELRERGYER